MPLRVYGRHFNRSADRDAGPCWPCAVLFLIAGFIRVETAVLAVGVMADIYMHFEKPDDRGVISRIAGCVRGKTGRSSADVRGVEPLEIDARHVRRRPDRIGNAV